MPDTYPAASLETAAAIWEAVLDIKESNPEVKATFENIGTSHLRCAAVRWTELVDAAWERVKDEYEGSWDWEFIPDWLAANIDWSGPNPVYKIGGR
jgi:hypothetical protein